MARRGQDASKRSGKTHRAADAAALPASCWATAVAVAVVAAGAMVHVWMQQQHAGSHTNQEQTTSVRRLQWSPSKPFARQLADAGVPVVLQNSVTTTWAAARLWKEDYIAERVSVLEQVYTSQRHVFGPYFDPTRPLTPFISATGPPHKTNVTMDTRAFFRRSAEQQLSSDPSRPGQEFVYYSGEIDRFGEWALNDISPFDELIVLQPQRTSINVWMGKDVKAHCHFDGYHNFYAQLKGHKRFVLWPPTDWAALHVFPFLHPSHAQAQVNTSVPWLPFEGPVKIPKGIVVDLNPGDLLYLPPLWFHEVESVGLSLSVNAWTDTEQTTASAAMFDVGLPVRDLGPALDPVSDSAARVLEGFGAVFAECGRGHTWTGMLRVLVRARYRTLLCNQTLVGGDKGLCGSAFSTTAELPWLPAALCPSQHESKPTSLRGFAAVVCAAANTLPNQTWEIWMANWMEGLAARSVGVRLTAALLLLAGTRCL
eukprot:m.151137 g.151137  ORF g.151137 m.151137 type:complete len:483 (-) comp17400_c0_seq5:161-1609(-)